MELPESTAQALLARWPVARLASLRPDGAPHLVPVVFARAAERLWIPVDAKPKRAGAGELQRVRNLRRDPRAALLLDHWEADWRRLWWLRADAEAELVEGEEALREAAAALRAKYPQYAGTPLFRDVPRAVALRVRRLRSWCASREAAEAAEGAAAGAAEVPAPRPT